MSRHRRWVVVGAIVAIAIGTLTGYKPSLSSGLEKRGIELGAAESTMLVDVTNSSLSNTEQDLESLSARAPVYGQVMTGDRLTRAVARRAHVPWSQVSATSATVQQPGSETRGKQILDENHKYRLFFQSQLHQPLIVVLTQAPSGKEAIRLANAATVEIVAYVNKLRGEGGKQTRGGLILRPLGRAQGGTVNPGVNKVASVLAAFGAFIAFCLLILLVSSVRASLRRLRTAGAVAQGQPVAGQANGNGHRVDEQAPYRPGTPAQEPDVASVRSIRRG